MCVGGGGGGEAPATRRRVLLCLRDDKGRAVGGSRVLPMMSQKAGALLLLQSPAVACIEWAPRAAEQGGMVREEQMKHHTCLYNP